nr:RCC1 domain-containing protein [Jiangella mangrovi]
MAIQNGAVWAWGDNFWGQLGDGTFDDSSVPVQAATGFNAGWTDISAGYDHSVATYGTEVYTWGYVVKGPCCLAEPIALDGLTDTVAITAGPTGWFGPHLAVQSDGTAWFWGEAFFSPEEAPDFDW